MVLHASPKIGVFFVCSLYVQRTTYPAFMIKVTVDSQFSGLTKSSISTKSRVDCILYVHIQKNNVFKLQVLLACGLRLNMHSIGHGSLWEIARFLYFQNSKFFFPQKLIYLRFFKCLYLILFYSVDGFSPKYSLLNKRKVSYRSHATFH